jgi:putative PIN family toxin of toxin-antitoxin system
LRVVIDTNVLISALIRRDSIPDAVMSAWGKDRFTLLTHAFQLDELRNVSRRPHIRGLFHRSEAGRLVNDLRADTDMIDRLPLVRGSADAADDFLLALCEVGRADYLVTGDKTGLLALRTHRHTTSLTARVFLNLLGR